MKGESQGILRQLKDEIERGRAHRKVWEATTLG